MKRDKKIEQFYKNLKEYCSNTYIYLLMTGIFEFIYMVGMVIPYKEMFSLDLIGVFFLVGIAAVALYMTPYRHYSVDGRQYSIDEKLKYLPVSLKQLKKERTKYLLSFVIKTGIVIFILQCLFSALAYHEISIWCLFYAFFVAFIWPFVLCFFIINCEQKGSRT